jgi:alkylation response protein AidB-like acyl-CoA dehydrogenase
MADFGGDVETFRTEVRDWLEANFPKALAGKPELQLAKLQAQPETPEALAWRKALGAKGWGVPHWPKEVGGGGLSREQIKVLHEEMAKIGARNPIGGMGVTFFGPTLLEYGTEALKKRALPGHRHRRGALVPGLLRAGRGLGPGRLQTRAEDKGDHYPRERARKSGRAARSTPTAASAWCGPTRRRSTRASASC